MAAIPLSFSEALNVSVTSYEEKQLFARLFDGSLVFSSSTGVHVEPTTKINGRL
jgi:hypothetical protein